MKDFEWCTDCKEYNHEKHCCPRWNKVIRTTLNDNINAVLDDIRAKIEEYSLLTRERVIGIIDKYKAERSEETDANSD